MLALVDLLTVADSIAAQVAVFETALNTVTAAAAANRDLLASRDDATVHEDLIPALARRVALVSPSTMFVMLQGAMVQRAFDKHYGASGGSLNGFLQANDARVHGNLRKIGMQIDSRNVFPLVVDPVATYEGTGAGTGIFAAGSDVNTEIYGEAALEIVVDAWGNSARTVRVTAKTFDGPTEDRDVVVPADSLVGAIVAVGGAGDRYVGVTNITTVGGGGTAADRARVRSVIERNI
jgi:hypothetical protein